VEIASQPTAEPLPPATLSRIRILIVEDMPADAELIEHELRRGGIAFDAKRVENKRAFMKELRENTPDLIISDFNLPQFNALDALHALKAHGAEIPFVLVTGAQSEEVAVECIKEGADDYILKSSLKRLPSAVLSALDKARAQRDREAAVNSMRASEEQFRALIENSSDLVTIITPDGVIRYASPSTERVLGFTSDQLIHQSLFMFVHESDRDSFRDKLHKLCGANTQETFNFRLRHRDESWRVFESIGKNLIHNPGVEGVVITSRDATDRLRAEEQIREQAALLDKAQDAIMVLDMEGRVTFWNKSAARLYGWTSEEMLRTNAVSKIFPPDLPNLAEARESTVLKGDWIGELKQLNKEGKELWVESRWSLIRDRNNEPRSTLIINTDITDRKKLEAHLSRAQRMESIGALAGGVAHDLNNVLTPILMAVRMLRDEVKDNSAHELIDTLETSAQRGASIVQQVLSFARGGDAQRSIFSLKHPLSEVTKIARDVFPPSVHIRARIAKDLWPIEGDPTQMHQVFMNLLVNARDAMPHGGRLQVDAENRRIDENYARMHSEAQPGPYVVVTVTDTGTGIPPGVIDKIFEPFFTTKEIGKGTGLGLSTVMGIVRGHGGFINVYSEPNKGTSFKVHFPAARAAIAEIEKSGQLELPRGNGELILVVDDEQPVRDILRMTLEDNGYRALTASDGAEAVAVYAEHRSEIDLLIVDIMMPIMDGPATVRAIQRFNPKAKFLIVSGLMDNEKVATMQEFGPLAFLAKPFTTEQLLGTLADQLKATAPEPAASAK